MTPLRLSPLAMRRSVPQMVLLSTFINTSPSPNDGVTAVVVETSPGCGVDNCFHGELLLSFHARDATQQHVCCGFIGNETADKTTGGGSADNAHFVSTVCHSQRVGECSDVFDV